MISLQKVEKVDDLVCDFQSIKKSKLKKSTIHFRANAEKKQFISISLPSKKWH